MYLVSNTKLGAAIRLYRKHGFQTTRLGPEVGQEAGYERADIEMVLTLSACSVAAGVLEVHRVGVGS